MKIKVFQNRKFVVNNQEYSFAIFDRIVMLNYQKNKDAGLYAKIHNINEAVHKISNALNQYNEAPENKKDGYIKFLCEAHIETNILFLVEKGLFYI